MFTASVISLHIYIAFLCQKDQARAIPQKHAVMIINLETKKTHVEGGASKEIHISSGFGRLEKPQNINRWAFPSCLFTHAGRVLFVGSFMHLLDCPQSGWCERLCVKWFLTLMIFRRRNSAAWWPITQRKVETNEIHWMKLNAFLTHRRGVSGRLMNVQRERIENGKPLSTWWYPQRFSHVLKRTWADHKGGSQ